MKNCPSCGRPIKFEEKYARILACWYCNSILNFWNWELNKIWEQSEFIDFPSIFIVWKNIKWEWKNIYVKWQLRYEYDWGFFDEYFAEIDWETFFIKEDDWQNILFKKGKWENSDIFLLDKNVWKTQNILWKNIFIQEIWTFKLISMKWYFDFDLILWEKYEYLNWIFDWKMCFFEKKIWENKIRFSISE